VISRYGFAPDLSKTVLQNATQVLEETPWWYYSTKPANLKFHDLTINKIMPPAVSSLLGQNLKFIPTPSYTTGGKEMLESLDRLERDLHLKIYFSGSEDDLPMTKLYVKSDWRPQVEDIPHWIDTRHARFAKAIVHAFRKRRAPSNLLPFQRRLFQDLLARDDIIIANTDKGLGPCSIELIRYMRDLLIHLEDESIYDIISEEEAMERVEQLKTEIEDWLDEFEPVLEESDHTYISTHLHDNQDPFGYFYLLYKIHKLSSLDNVDIIPTRPVCSSCGSIDHSLGAWVNEQLQPVAQAQPSFIQNSAALLKELHSLQLPPDRDAYLLTADATAMYPNIDTNAALEVIPEYLEAHENEFEYNAEALIAALHIVFRNNLFKCGNLYISQKSGTAMGKRPAPPWATIYFAIHENKFVPMFESVLFFYRRYIDDVFAIWLAHPDPAENARLWQEFKSVLNDFHGLKWKIEPLSKSGVAFMDMSLSIVNGKIHSTLYEKPMALHLYIPPSSAHPPGVLAGLVMGNVLRIFQICSVHEDREQRLNQFLERLLNRGHQESTLLPLFKKAIDNAIEYLSKSDEEKLAAKELKAEAARKRVYFHVPYHPNNPTAATIQRLWRLHVAEPVGELPLNKMENIDGAEVEIEKMIVAYHRAPNLGNRFSYRKIDDRNGPKLSSFLKKG